MARLPVKKTNYILGIIFSLSGNAISILGSLLTIAVASRCLSKEEIGVYYIVLMITSLTVAIAGFGGRSSIIRFMAASEPNEQSDTVNVLFTIRLLAVLIVGAGLSVFLVFADRMWPANALAQVKWMIFPIVITEILVDMFMSMLAGFNLFRQFAFFLGAKGGGVSAASILLLVFGFGLNSLLLGLLLVNLGIILAVWLMLPQQFRLRWDSVKIREIVKFSGALYLAFIVSIISARTAEAMIVSFMGAAVLAVYGNAIRFPNLLLRVFEAVRPIILNYFSSGKEKDHTTDPLRIMATIVGLTASVLIMFAKPIVLLVFSEEYLSAIPLTRLLSLWMVMSLINYFLVIQLTGSNHPLKVLWINLLQFLFVIVGHLMLIPRFGATGAALSITIGAFVSVLFSAYLVYGTAKALFFESLVTILRPVIPLFVLYIIVENSDPDLVTSLLFWVGYLVSLFLLGTLNIMEIKKFVHQIKVSG